jgi:hypothetical protein
LIGILLTLLLSSCGQTTESPKGNLDPNRGERLSIPVPIQLQKHLSNEMIAEIVVVGTGQTFPLVVDRATRTVTGTIDGVPIGEHTFELYFYINGIKVATARTAATIVANSTVLISFASLTYPDNDGDGFTNLAELEAGTDPNNAGSHPPAELPRASANYVMADLIGISPFVGTSTNENKSISLGTLSFGATKQTSGNYTVTSGP